MSNDKRNSFGLFDAPKADQCVVEEPIIDDTLKQVLKQGAFFMSSDEALQKGLLTENESVLAPSIA